MGPRFESVKAHQWPVGQVVKTAASHAVNIGSNPVRVTTKRRSGTFSETLPETDDGERFAKRRAYAGFAGYGERM